MSFHADSAEPVKSASVQARNRLVSSIWRFESPFGSFTCRSFSGVGHLTFEQIRLMRCGQAAWQSLKSIIKKACGRVIDNSEGLTEEPKHWDLRLGLKCRKEEAKSSGLAAPVCPAYRKARSAAAHQRKTRFLKNRP